MPMFVDSVFKPQTSDNSILATAKKVSDASRIHVASEPDRKDSVAECWVPIRSIVAFVRFAIT